MSEYALVSLFTPHGSAASPSTQPSHHHVPINTRTLAIPSIDQPQISLHPINITPKHPSTRFCTHPYTALLADGLGSSTQTVSMCKCISLAEQSGFAR